MVLTTDIAKATLSDMSNVVTEYSVNNLNTDGAGDQDETEYQNTDWSKYWGLFNEIPDLKSALLMKAVWRVGKGWEADPRTTVILDHISGWGKDTFDEILFNMVVTACIGGDAFCEIILDEETGELINLKPLDPGSMKIIVDGKGIIKRYEQTSKVKGKKPHKFKPNEIFHLSNNRLADQIHGISDIKSIEKTVLADMENFEDMRKIMHRQARPMIMFKLKTDDQAVINAFIVKMDEATKKGENIYVPNDDAAVDIEVIQVDVSQVVMQWRDNLKNRFYRAVSMPQIVFGSAGTTESGGKIEYLAHEQVFEKDQRQLEMQIWNQLGLRINLISPISLLENLQADESKDAQNAITMQQNDVQGGSGRDNDEG